ncbi:MAG: patatin-like phospholipase family protein [Flavobacteriaceae bacterium]|jgi:NTE family protein|nr:patatin-like phospholipase family protein [Flavobacteriaceae bacterium]
MELEKDRYKLGITLGGGGAKGFAHLGVIQALNDRGLYPDIISGTSAGAFAGVLYADGNSPRDIISFFKEMSFTQFAQFSIPKGGVFKSTPFYSFLNKHLKAKTFEELKLSMYVTATDIERGELEYFNSGDLIPAVIASCSIPVIFTPVEINKRYYVDGGLIKKFPVSILRPKCEKIIGVNVSPVAVSKYKNTINYVAERAFRHMSNANVLQDRKLCNYLIESEVLCKYSLFDLKHIEEIFQMGYEIAHKYMEKHEKELRKDFVEFI